MKFDEGITIDHVKDDFGRIREILKTREQEDAFYILDLGDVINKHRMWLSKIPRVEPHFAMKSHPDSTVVKTLAALNVGFHCSSKYEIEQALSMGVFSERILFANTIKPASHIKFSREVGVKILMADNQLELLKIKNIFPEAKIVIRFRCAASMTQAPFGSKCGCDSVTEAPKLIRIAKDLGLDVHGFSFHVGTQCGETTAWGRGIKISLGLIDYAKSLGFQDVKLIDIGGGFPGERDHPIDEIAVAINEALEEVDPSIRVISEPGRYYVASAFTLASLIYGKRSVQEGNTTRHMYYVNDGTYGSFVEVMLNLKTLMPRPLNKPVSEKTYPSTFWGPTCDSFDCVVRDCNFAEQKVGDWLVWPDMGAYTVSLAGNFNGLFSTVVFPFITRKEWNLFLDGRIVETNGWLNG